MVQSTHRPSSFAAADLALVESPALPRLKAPLLWWGSSCAVGGGGRPSVPPLRRKTAPLITRAVPLIRLAYGQLPLLAFSHFPLTGGIGLPLKGKAFGRLIAAPTAENGPGALVWQRQAQLWNRSGL